MAYSVKRVLAWPIQKQVAAGLGISSLCLILLSIYTYQSLEGTVNATDWRAHSSKVITELKNMTSHLQQADQNIQRYFLTKDGTYLPLHRQALNAAESDLEKILLHTRNNPQQQRRLQAIKPIVDHVVVTYQSSLKDYQHSENPNKLIIKLILQHQQLTDDIEKRLGKLEAEEAELWQQYNAQARQHFYTTFTLSLCGVLTTLTVLAILFVLMSREMGRRRQAEEEARMASRLKSEFMANMSHEIRTPLSGILSFAEVMLQSEISPELQKCVHMIQTSGRTLLSVINDILDFSKIEAGKVELNITPFPLRETISEIIPLFAPVALEKNIELLYQIEPDVPNNLIGDVTRVKQILLNLLGNAIKFTEQGRVFLNVETNRQYETTNDTCLLYFRVIDTGIGLNTDQLQRIFDPFTQADGATTRKYGGTGLGLSITAQLLTIMKGKIWVESEPGKGSVFHFSLPFEIQQPSAISSETTRQSYELNNFQKWRKLPSMKTSTKSMGLSILLAEDNLINQIAVQKIMEHSGYRVHIATNGKATLDKLNAHKFDLILMDVHMPEMDGFTVTAAIRAEEIRTGQPQIPIIAFTANAFDDCREQCLAAGMNGFLKKPFEARQLLELIHSFGIHPTDIYSKSEDLLSKFSHHPLLDTERILERFGHCHETLSQIIRIFSTDSAQLLDKTAQAIQGENKGQLLDALHALKNNVGHFTSKGPAGTIQAMDRLARQDAFLQCDQHYGVLRLEIMQLEQALQQLLTPTSAGAGDSY